MIAYLLACLLGRKGKGRVQEGFDEPQSARARARRAPGRAVVLSARCRNGVG